MSGGTSTTAAASTTSSRFGTLDSPCGKGDAKGATDQGVTDTSISIGYGDDAGYSAAPGLDHQVSDAVKAFVKWCNDQGGINGRQINADYYDAKVTEITNVVTEACGKEFYLVGEYWVLDDAQETPRRECKLPAVPAAAGTAKFANAPLMHDGVPGPIDRAMNSAVVQLKKLFPDEIKQAGIFWANYPVIVDRRDQELEALASAGYDFKSNCSVSYNVLGEADWKPLVQKFKDCGAKLVYFLGSPVPNFENILEAANQLGFKPVWYVDTNFYDLSFAKWNSSGFADRVYMRQAFIPQSEAKDNAAGQQFLDVLKATKGDPNQFGEQAASSFLLWATAAKSCGSTLTRACVEAKLASIHEWTGGGLHAKTDPGGNLPTSCGFLMGMKGTDFVRVTPKEANSYDCDPSYLYTVTGDVIRRNKIGADRIAQL